jgi:hypothetical protein
MDELRRIFEWLEIALWWLDEVLFLLSFVTFVIGIYLRATKREYQPLYWVTTILCGWALYALLWSV